MGYAARYVCRKIKEKLCKTAYSNQQMIKCFDGLIEDRRQLRGELSLLAEWMEMIGEGYAM